MANDTDMARSSTVFMSSSRASSSSSLSSPTPTSPATPGSYISHSNNHTPRKPSATRDNDFVSTPKYSMDTTPPSAIDTRRTQSATNLTRPLPSSSATSPPSSPRNSLTDTLSRSSSFLAVINSNISLLAGAVAVATSSPTAAATAFQSSGPVHAVKVVYSDPGPLYVDLYSRADGRGAFVKSFRRKTDGALGNAEASGQVRVNDMLYSINDLVVTELVFASIIQAAKTTTFPCTLVFHSRLPPPPTTPGAASPAKPLPATPVGAGGAGVSTTWSSKLGQMMGGNSETGLKRSASFERKSFGDGGVAASPGLVRRPSSAAAHPSTPPLGNNGGNAGGGNGAETPGKPKNWGVDSISLDKVKNSDGVKNLLRMMGGAAKSRPEEDRETVETWLAHLELKLEDGNHHNVAQGYLFSPLIAVTTAVSGGRMLGVKDDDLNEFAFTWFRKTQAQDLIQIKSVRGGRYFPSVDDVDAKISVRCHSLRFPNLMRVVEFSHPLRMDPEVKEMVDILLEAGAGSFSATLASNEHDSFQIKISEERVVLVKISEDEDEGGVVVSAEYHVHLQVLLDPNDQLRFTLKVQELGSLLGCRAGDSCDVKRKQQLAGVSCFFLVAQNPQHRDILALLIRRFRARAVLREEEDVAHRDELNLFMDPASSSLHGGGVGAAGQEMGQDDASSQSNGRRSFMPSAERRHNSHPKMSQLDVPTPPPPPADTLTDLFGLENDAEALGLHGGSMATHTQDVVAMPSSRTASFPNASPLRSSQTTSSEIPNSFVQDRMVAQAKEIAMLQDKLASMSVLVKSTEHEKSELVASLEVKDKRIESQQMRVQQLERSNVQLGASCRELQQLRSRLDDETKQHQACQQQLAKALEERQECEMKDHSTQTDKDVEVPESYRLALEQAESQATALGHEVKDLRQQLTSAQAKLQHLQGEHHVMLSERNALRSRSSELAKELKTVVGPHRSLVEVQAQLQERTHLASQLSVARADAKRAVDEMQEYKDALDSTLKQQQQSGLADKDKAATQRLVAQNTELQRLVHQLTDSLNETREQMGAMKKINSALMSKLQRENPDFRGSTLESPPMSPLSVASSVQDPRFSDDEDEDDDDEEHGEDDGDEGDDNEEEEEDGEAGQVVRVARSVQASSATSEDFGDALDEH